ncbi:ammonium transporter [Kitasatospora purpeofusca]|uniref:ammonium transporter n=1 Tax=Kitasatospora purpeofusca TaxID=67352 RepID=UPI0022501179|nr:ammonium transporter [Kitasatospora purpeofusca]MCX4752392.1 ammonium transporter [Kitasatospora purpeofusca]WSR31968.1 ammonium transporter [Kitasatospora purpeofusca]WSR39995.1 ammonium transporter [Kitasatospora purpeofusca]
MLLAASLAVSAAAPGAASLAADAPSGIDTGDTAWLLAATALVLLMTPGLALFYGGMVRAKSVLNMIMMSFVSIAVVTVVWLLAGYSLAFGPDAGGWGLIGGLDHLGMAGITPASVTGTVPTVLFATFQLTFAIITAALISGAIADRARFGAWVAFTAVWTLLVYVPVAHWVFAPGGWILSRLGALDFAGGTVVEVNCGASGLALALLLGPRIGFRKEAMRPHSLPLVLLGAGLLWFGWFGFNAGSALGANGLAASALLNTQAAGCTGLLGWLLVEKRRDGHATTLGAASGAVAGLVAITPSCGSVDLLGALAIGLAAGVVCSYAVSWKFRFGFDDSLDVVGVHFVAGAIGTVLIGLFATATMTGGATGLLHGGGFGQLGRQLVAVAAVAVYAFAVTYGIGWAIERLMGFRAGEEDELTGLDLAVHAETAYDHGVLGHGVLGQGSLPPRPTASVLAHPSDKAPSA